MVMVKLSKRDLALARQIAIELGRRGGKVRAANLTKAQRIAAAKKAAKARWAKRDAAQEKQ